MAIQQCLKENQNSLRKEERIMTEKDIEKITVTAEFVRGEGELIKHKRA